MRCRESQRRTGAQKLPPSRAVRKARDAHEESERCPAIPHCRIRRGAERERGGGDRRLAAQATDSVGPQRSVHLTGGGAGRGVMEEPDSPLNAMSEDELAGHLRDLSPEELYAEAWHYEKSKNHTEAVWEMIAL